MTTLTARMGQATSAVKAKGAGGEEYMEALCAEQGRRGVGGARKLHSNGAAVSTHRRNTSSILGVVLSSIRRVKKGSGRRPQSAEHERFMRLREQGWSIAAAARKVGASRSAGHKWARGYKTYRDGVVVGFVPALDRREVRQISGRFLSQDETPRVRWVTSR